MRSTRTRGSCQSSKPINHFTLRSLNLQTRGTGEDTAKSTCQRMRIGKWGIAGPGSAIGDIVATFHDVNAGAIGLHGRGAVRDAWHGRGVAEGVEPEVRRFSGLWGIWRTRRPLELVFGAAYLVPARPPTRKHPAVPR